MAAGLENHENDKPMSLLSESVTTSRPPVLINRLAVVGKGIRHNNVLLPHMLQANIRRWYPWSGMQHMLDTRLLKWLPAQKKHSFSSPLPQAFVGWGHKKSYQRATKAAKRQQLSTISIEDGFLRSLNSGISSRYGLSVVMDDVGIYFESRHHSRLEQLIVTRSQQATIDPNSIGGDEARAKSLIKRICDDHLSKYNSTVECPCLNRLAQANSVSLSNTTTKPHVLLIDQVAGDASVVGAGANKRQFKKMLKTACRRHPDAYIWIKAHPAAKTGYLTGFKLPKNVYLLKQSLNPIKLLAQVSDVYTVSSHMGFEALMLGKTVHCFGVSWYSGWGLTDDSGAPQRLLKTVKARRQEITLTACGNKANHHAHKISFRKKTVQATLETLFYSAYIDYSRYADPASQQACEIDTAIDWLLTNRQRQSDLAGVLTVYEFSRWKLPFVKAFVAQPLTTIFIKPKPRLKNLLHPSHLRVNYQQPLLVWGLAKRQQVQNKKAMQALAQKPPVYCMEDGFIRSNGLGATLLAPLSVVIDKRGIYYDATQPSDLEVLLRDCSALSATQTTRVQALKHKLLTQRVSKYNVGNSVKFTSTSKRSTWIELAAASGKPRILVVGQVEDDLSVQYCGSQVQTNSELIERVRQDSPDAYLIYKPHPDVEAGLRKGKVSAISLQQVDAVAHDTAMPDCLACIDEVHTISSLTGFEALLRGVTVVCYGLPFYAGWGLTEDKHNTVSPKVDYLQRRKRQTPLTLEQLIHCTLIRYPLYRLPEGHGLAQIEQVIDYLYPSAITLTLDSNQQLDSQNKPEQSNLDLVASIRRLPSNTKRRAATRFMQYRHRLQQLTKK